MYGDRAAILWTWGQISHADLGWEQETGLLMATLSQHNSLKLPVSMWKQNSFIYLCCCNRDWCYSHLNTIPDNILSSLTDERMTSFGLLLNKGTLKIYIFYKPFLFLIEELHFLSIKIETVVYNKKKISELWGLINIGWVLAHLLLVEAELLLCGFFAVSINLVLVVLFLFWFVSVESHSLWRSRVIKKKKKSQSAKYATMIF